MRHFNLDSRDYDFQDKFVAGLILSGSDVKSLRTQTTPMLGSRVDVIDGYPKLFNIHIPKYKFSNVLDDSGERSLLLSNKEILKLISYKKQKLMMVPISIFVKGRFFKLEFGVGRKLKKHDKRQKIRSEEMKRKGEKY